MYRYLEGSLSSAQLPHLLPLFFLSFVFQVFEENRREPSFLIGAHFIGFTSCSMGAEACIRVLLHAVFEEGNEHFLFFFFFFFVFLFCFVLRFA